MITDRQRKNQILRLIHKMLPADKIRELNEFMIKLEQFSHPFVL